MHPLDEEIMPEFLERALQKEATKKGFTGKRAKKYVYGGMNSIGAMHGNQITPKGQQMERKHLRAAAMRRTHG